MSYQFEDIALSHFQKGCYLELGSHIVNWITLWRAAQEMWADGLTKEMEMAEGLRNLLKEGRCKITSQEINKVVCQNREIRMMNIRNRKKKEETKEKEGNQE